MDMKSKATTSIWSFDAFQCLIGRSYPQISPEVISRVNAFLEAYALFDSVVVSEAYFQRNRGFFNRLDPSGTISHVVPSSALVHAEILSEKGITIDLSLLDQTPQELKQDSRLWFLEHQPTFGELDLQDDPDMVIASAADNFYQLRLWQWCVCKEMADLTGATIILPNSLRGIEKLDSSTTRWTNDFFLKTFEELKETFGKEVTEIAFASGTPYLDEIGSMPPVFARYLDLHSASSSPFDALKTLRDEMSEARFMRSRFESDLRGCQLFDEKRELVSKFNADWKRVVDSEFRTPKLFTSEVSTVEIIKAAIDASQLKVSAGTSIVEKVIEYARSKKAHRRFKSYTKLYSEAGNVLVDENFQRKLGSSFGVQDIRRYITP